MALNDELLKVVNSQERVYIYFYDSQELIGVPTINSRSNRLIYKQFEKSAFCFSTYPNTAYYLTLDKNGRIVLVENCFDFMKTRDGSIPLNIRTVDFYTADEMNILRKGIAPYQHNLLGSIKKIAFLNERLRPIPELSNLYVIDSSILMAYLRDENSNKSIVYPFDESIAFNGLSAFLSLFQVESDQYQRGLGKEIISLSEQVIADYFKDKGQKAVFYGGKLVPLDGYMKFSCTDGENPTPAVIDEWGVVHRFDGRYSSSYYTLCQIYKKLKYSVNVVPDKPFIEGEKPSKLTKVSKLINTEETIKNRPENLDGKWVRPDKYLPDKLNNFELIY